MGDTKFWPKLRSGAAKRRLVRLRNAGVVIALLLAGALLDPQIISPFGPLADRPERVSATFTRCGQGSSFACVVDGDTIRLGERRVRILGIDAPEMTAARCPGERALAESATNRLVALVNQGSFDMIGHRFWSKDGYGRDLRVLRRGDVSIGKTLTDEGLAKRYYGAKLEWC